MDNISFDLSGRVALVTGASSGIGQQLCRYLSESGAKVIAAARSVDRLENLVEELRKKGGQAVAVHMDVADTQSVADAYDAGERAFGTINTIYANAGTHVLGSALGLPMETFDQVMKTNLYGMIHTAREGASRLLRASPDQARRGRIVIVSSIRGLAPVVDNIAYCTSKAAMIMAGKTMALEWAESGINVNILCPGVIFTDISQWFYETEEGKARLSAYPRKRTMSIDDLKFNLLYLGSDVSGTVTGSVITVDDGQTL